MSIGNARSLLAMMFAMDAMTPGGGYMSMALDGVFEPEPNHDSSRVEENDDKEDI